MKTKTKTKSSMLSRKDGEPSFNIKQRDFFLVTTFIAIIAFIIVFVYCGAKKANGDSSGGDTTGAAQAASATDTDDGGAFGIGGGSGKENMKVDDINKKFRGLKNKIENNSIDSRRAGMRRSEYINIDSRRAGMRRSEANNIGGKIDSRFKGLKNTIEKQSGKLISSRFSKDLKPAFKEKDMGTPDLIFKAPKGVQPGTLKVPPIGYTRVPPMYDSRFGFKENGASAKYKVDPGAMHKRLFMDTTYVDAVAPDQKAKVAGVGYQTDWNDNALNGLMPTSASRDAQSTTLAGAQKMYKDSGLDPENLIAEERGTTFHSFGSSGNLSDGITGKTWGEPRQDWTELKAKTKNVMQDIADMFDQMFRKDIFPQATVENIGAGVFQIKDKKTGKCIMLERYYQYVAATMAVQLGEEPEQSLNWAEGSSLELGFQGIEKSVPALQVGLLINCSDSAGYKKLAGGKIMSLDNDALVAFTLKWPQDQTDLFTHEMSIDKNP